MRHRTKQKAKRAQSNREAPANPLMAALQGVEDAEKLRLAGKLEKAQSVCMTLLKQYPDYVAALQTMGLVQADRGNYEKALGYLHRASMHAPDETNILTALSGVYLQLGASRMAARSLEQARRLSPGDAGVLVTLGEIYREEKEYEQAIDAFKSALASEPGYAVAEIGLAMNLVQTGELAPAAEIFERHLKSGSRSLSLLYMLSQLPRSMVTIDTLELLDEAEAQIGPSMTDGDRAQLAFTRAAALDKSGAYENAWSQITKGRRHGAAENRKAYAQLKQRHAPLLAQVRAAPILSASSNPTDPDVPVSLFIVGPSRSGKTSLERLVGCLYGVKRGYENPIVENAVRAAFQRANLPTRHLLSELPPQLGPSFKQHYLDELQIRAGDATILTNTLPGRNEDALRVATELPNTRFVFVKRDLDDLCLRIYMRNYKRGNFYASDLNDIRDYLAWCHEMMDAMAEKMPGISQVTTYEDMIADPKATLAQVCDLLDRSVGDAVLPQLGDDRGCGLHYRKLMEGVGSS